ncbi:MAG: hypothetical protein A3F72_11715 [Bacteroidetes bacterium RIFCSPLOWO2_12_FULL_35_15]|nr:MAG: hypothetical protein A3F72_11715 [Bacteroidetes bacterium RIFCSPLOWO2_12_FULL_35_15]
MNTRFIQFSLLIIIFSLFYSVAAFSQQNKPDSLFRLYETQTTVSKQLDVLIGICNSDFIHDKSTQNFVQHGIENIQNNFSTKCDTGKYYLIEGYLYYYSDENSKSKNNFFHSLNYLISCSDLSVNIPQAYNGIASVYSSESKSDSVLFYYQKEIDFYLKNKQFSFLPKAYFNLAFEKYEFFDAKGAITACNQSIKFGTIQKEYKSIAKAYSLLSRISYDQNTKMNYSFIESAIYFAKKSNDTVTLSDTYTKYGYYLTKDKKYKEGLEIGDQLKELFLSNPDIYKLEFNYYQYFSRYYSAIGDITNSLLFYNKTINLIRKNKLDEKSFGWIFNNMGDVACKGGDFKKGIIFLDSAIYYNKKYNDINNLWYSYYNMALANQALKNYKLANDYFLEYLNLNDSIIKKENQDKLAELQTKYELDKKESRLKLLNLDNQLNKKNTEKQSQQILFLLVIIAVTVLLIVLASIAYNIKRKANILLSKQKQEIIEKTEQLNKQAADIAMYKAQMNPHFLFNAINSVQQFVLEKQSSVALEYLNDLSKLMRSTLNFSDKEFISIKEEIDYLQQYIRFEKLRCDNKFEFHIFVTDEIDIENTCILPMLIQPFIENAVKHGIIPKNAKGNIYLNFEKVKDFKNEFLKITISDDGVGRALSQATKKYDVIAHESKGMEITENRIFKLNQKHFPEPIKGIKIIDIFVEDKSAGTKAEILIPFIELF